MSSCRYFESRYWCSFFYFADLSRYLAKILELSEYAIL